MCLRPKRTFLFSIKHISTPSIDNQEYPPRHAADIQGNHRLHRRSHNSCPLPATRLRFPTVCSITTQVPYAASITLHAVSGTSSPIFVSTRETLEILMLEGTLVDNPPITDRLISSMPLHDGAVVFPCLYSDPSGLPGRIACLILLYLHWIILRDRKTVDVHSLRLRY